MVRKNLEQSGPAAPVRLANRKHCVLSTQPNPHQNQLHRSVDSCMLWSLFRQWFTHEQSDWSSLSLISIWRHFVPLFFFLKEALYMTTDISLVKTSKCHLFSAVVRPIFPSSSWEYVRFTERSSSVIFRSCHFDVHRWRKNREGALRFFGGGKLRDRVNKADEILQKMPKKEEKTQQGLSS